MMMGAVHQKLVNFVANSKNAAAAWTMLGNRFDRDMYIYTTYFTLYRRLLMLRMPEDGDLRQHMDDFDTIWT